MLKVVLKIIGKFLLLLAFQLGFAALLLTTAFNQTISTEAFEDSYFLQQANDSIFVVGALMVSFGLITFTNAGKVFDGFRFAAKQMFGRKKLTHMAYYDYKRTLESRREDRVIGVYPLLTGLVFVILSATFGFMYFS